MASCVRGTLVTGLTDGDVWRLDIFEGAEYVRRGVRVSVLRQDKRTASSTATTASSSSSSSLPYDKSGEGEGEGGMGDISVPEAENVEAEEVDAETYIWVAGAHRLEAEEWDFAEFVREKMGRWVGGDAADEGFRGRQSFLGI